MTISDSEARRIAAEWQAPGNGFSALQHVGAIPATLLQEIENTIDTEAARLPTVERLPAIHDLTNLYMYVREHGPRANVVGWAHEVRF